jgi:predicted TIM-barrel fold metal-dependent hydrolase
MSPVIYSEMSRRLTRMSAERLTLEMAENQVKQAVAVAMDPYVPTREVVAACEATKGILLPFGSVDPWARDWTERLDEALSLPIRGLKFHDQLQRVAYGEPRFMDIIARIADRRPELPIYLHTGTFPIYKPMEHDWPFGLNRLLTSFPTLRFVCGHCGWNRPSAALRAARRHANLFLETSWQPPQVLRRLCDALGPERLLLGSDYPLFSMRRAIRNCRTALTPAEFRSVSEENAHRLLEDRRS